MRRLLVVAIVFALCGLAQAGPMEEGLDLLGKGKFAEALAAFDRELKVRPANTKAYIYAAMTAEKIPDMDRAAQYWENLLKLTQDGAEKDMATQHLAICRAKPGPVEKTTTDKSTPKTDTKEGTEVFNTAENQWFKATTEHFMVMAKNRELAQKAAEAGEGHLKRICAAFIRGQIWPRVISVYIFKNHEEYVTERGLPDWSGGGYSYMPFSADNVLRRVDLFQLDKDGKWREDLLDQVLPHELTHVVMEEWFGGRGLPRAFNEGLAMYVEEGTHQDYEEFSARAVAAGQYYHFKDLFGMQGYPPQVGVFYVESASATRYLIEHLSAEQFNGLMDAIKKGEDMNTALCTAMGRVGDLLGNMETNWVAWKKEVAATLPKDTGKKSIDRGQTKETQPPAAKTPKPSQK